MTKAELVEAVSLQSKLTKKAAAQVMRIVFQNIGNAVKRDERFSYPGFGTFTKRRRNSRTVRNPSTGEPIAIPAQCTVVFTPGQELKNLINRVPSKNASSAA